MPPNRGHVHLNAPWDASDWGNGTAAQGIDGSLVVGLYTDSASQQHGFLYDGTTYTAIDHPLGINGTNLYDVSGN